MTFLLANWKFILFGLVITGLCIALKVQTWRLDKALAQNLTYQEIVKSYKQKSLQAESDQKAIEKKSQVVTKAITDSYEYQIKELHKYYANHPRVKLVMSSELRNMPADSSTSKSEVPDTTQGTDATTTHDPVVTVEQCADTTLQLVKLQEWIKTQQLIFDKGEVNE